MLTKHTVFEISREGYGLLRNTLGNNGRTLRRFLSRVSADGLVLQVFTDYGTDLSPDELALHEVYAEQVRALSLEYVSHDVGASSVSMSDPMFSLAQNSYRLTCDIAAATVNELRSAVRDVVALSDCMHKFAANPGGEVKSVSPEAVAQRLEEAREREHQREYQQCLRVEAYLGFLRT